jgi:serine/threonine protein kinase/WD40 repeat protein
MAEQENRNPVEELAESFLKRYRQGERPSITEYVDKHPELGEKIRELFPALVVMEEIGAEEMGSADSARSSKVTPDGRQLEQIGDYRIIREIGHGGMGVVYEAEQESLGRHVALKVLPHWAGRDSLCLQRFRREARSAARLHHTNIVPVHEVGEAQGIHYYAMQYIQGQSLDEILLELRRLRKQTRDSPASEGAVLSRAKSDLSLDLAGRLATGRLPAEGAEPDAEGILADASGWRGDTSPKRERGQSEAGMGEPPAAIVTDARAGAGHLSSAVRDKSSELSDPSHTHYYRSVARVGLQVAEALAYAHAQKVLHRDIKPSNLLLDLQGTVWVTDFGLAKEEGEDLTQTGDLVGTLRYMAPERFSGRCDVRSDIYSLGLTLYELLALQPPYRESDRGQLIKEITTSEPPRLRMLDRQVPRDLETIVLKAISKEPAGRYQTADRLTEDLRRFLSDRPILARRTSTRERLWRWCRRNPAVAGMGGVIAALAFLLTVGGWWNAHRFRKERDVAVANEERAENAEQDATNKLWQSYLDQARAGRFTGQVGQRFHGLELLAKAAQIRPTIEVRNEAIACLALPDVRPVRKLEISSLYGDQVGFDAQLKRYVGCDEHGFLSLRRLSDNQEIRRLQAPGRCYWPEFSPDGNFLVAHSDSWGPGQLWLWDLRRASPKPSAIWHVAKRGGVVSHTFAPDGQTVAILWKEGSLSLCDCASGKELKQLSTNVPGTGEKLAFHPSGRQLAAIGNPGDVAMVLDLESAKIVKTFHTESSIHKLAWSGDGRLLACSGLDYRIHVWDMAADHLQAVLDGHQNRLDLRFIRGEFLVSWSWDETWRVWDPISGKQLLRSPGGFKGVGQGDRQVVSWDGQGFSLWELTINEECRTLHHGSVGNRTPRPEGWVNTVDFSSDGRWLVSAGSVDVRLWEVATGKLVASWPGQGAHAWFRPRHRELLTSTATGVQRSKPAHATGEAFHFQTPELLLPGNPKQNGTLCCWSNDGRWLAFRQPGQTTVIVQNAEDASKQVTLGPHPRVRYVALSPDARWLATGPWQGESIRVWEVATAKTVWELPCAMGSLTFSPDGRWLATGTVKECRLWRTGTWEPGSVRLTENGVGAMAFSHDSTILAVKAGRGRLVKLIEIASGTELATLEGPDPPDISWLSFSPDGSRLAVALQDYTVRIWDLRAIRGQLATIGLDWETPLQRGE